MEPHVEYFTRYEINLENAKDADRLYEALNKEIGSKSPNDRIYVTHELSLCVAVEIYDVQDLNNMPWWLLTGFNFQAKCEMILKEK